MKKIILWAVIYGTVTSSFAGEYEDVIQEAENVIATQYKTKRSYEAASQKLDVILKMQDISEEEKIQKIKKQFLSEENTVITKDNANKLIFVPMLSWNIHSIGIAYDIDNTQNILFSAQQLNAEDARETEQKNAERKRAGSWSVAGNAGAGVKASGEVSLNPASWFSPKAGFYAEANASIKGDFGKTNMDLWTKQNQKALSQRYESMKKILSDTKITGCHLTFAVTFRNHTEKDLLFPSTSTVPVYAGNDLLLNASPENVSNNQVQMIPAGGTTTVKFRGAINNTKASDLLSFMTQSTPSILPEQGQLFIHSADGTIRNAIQASQSVPTVSVTFDNMEWRIRRNWNGKHTTIREAFLAINSLYETPLIDFDKNGNAVKLFRKTFANQPDEIDLKTMPVVSLKYSGKTVFLLDHMDSTILDRKIPDQGLSLALVDIPKTLNDLTTEASCRKALVEKLFKLHEAGSAAAQLCLGYYYVVTKNYTEAVKWCRKAAEQGYANAQFELGGFYLYGVEVAQDYTEAVKWFRKAAEQGHTGAQYHLGVCYFQGEGVAQDYTEAVKWYRKAAEQGDADVQYELGVCYFQGEGVTKDYAEAVKWYRKAAEQGQADAQSDLGVCYFYGEGVTKDYAEAVKWYRKAAEQGQANAQNNLGFCYYYGAGVTKDYAEAVKWYRKAAEQGHANAQSELGVCYFYGAGVTKDYAEAVKWYRKAAEQGQAGAQCNLGDCYYYGVGVTKDYAEAVKWYRKAAEQGDAEAQYSLGLGYFQGKGVAQDYTEAVKWLRRAAEQGLADAQFNLGFYYGLGHGVTKDDAEAAKWFRKAAEQGHAEAQFCLGVCYSQGVGVAQDYTEAVKWYRKAAEQGHAGAQEALKKEK